ncbi:MAG TPA: hypothetical protein VFM96_04525 [Gaiellaceae bacterium]|nr:hypothetical protein [Gaiellaceae bacterium]
MDSGEPVGEAEHVTGYRSHRPLIALHEVVLGMLAFEVLRPPTRVRTA